MYRFLPAAHPLVLLILGYIKYIVGPSIWDATAAGSFVKLGFTRLKEYTYNKQVKVWFYKDHLQGGGSSQKNSKWHNTKKEKKC